MSFLREKIRHPQQRLSNGSWTSNPLEPKEQGCIELLRSHHQGRLHLELPTEAYKVRRILMPRPSLWRWTQERGQPKHRHPIRAQKASPRDRNHHRAPLCSLPYVRCKERKRDQVLTPLGLFWPESICADQRETRTFYVLPVSRASSWSRNYLMSPSWKLKLLNKRTLEH